MRIIAVTCVKNEGPFLLEWIVFNSLLGMTDVLFRSNDCADGTDALLDALAGAGWLTHLPSPTIGRNHQMEALKHAAAHPCRRATNGVWIADVDEFLNVKTGDHTIPALIDACGHPQAISVTFQVVANTGVETFVDAPVIAQFTRSHNPDIWCADSAIEVKTLVRRGLRCKRVLFPLAPGRTNHTRLPMAVTDPAHVDPLRFGGGCRDPADQARLRSSLQKDLAREIDAAQPEVVILSASQLGSSLHTGSEPERLKALLAPLSRDIRIVAHIDEPARLLARVHAAQILQGRAAPLARDLDLAAARAASGRPLPQPAQQKRLALQNSPFAPHHHLSGIAEDVSAPAFDPAPPRALAPGSTGSNRSTGRART